MKPAGTRVVAVLGFLGLCGLGPTTTPVVSVPAAGEAEAYFFAGTAGRNFKVKKELGDRVLAALEGGKVLTAWNGDPAAPIGSCVDPPPFCHTVEVRCRDGREVSLAFSSGAETVWVFEDVGNSSKAKLCCVAKGAKEEITKTLLEIEEQKRTATTAATRPLRYVVGSLEDGGSLSGIARLFYRDGRKWKVIYDANRKVISNPDRIRAGMELVIP